MKIRPARVEFYQATNGQRYSFSLTQDSCSVPLDLTGSSVVMTVDGVGDFPMTVVNGEAVYQHTMSDFPAPLAPVDFYDAHLTVMTGAITLLSDDFVIAVIAKPTESLQ